MLRFYRGKRLFDRLYDSLKKGLVVVLDFESEEFGYGEIYYIMYVFSFDNDAFDLVIEIIMLGIFEQNYYFDNDFIVSYIIGEFLFVNLDDLRDVIFQIYGNVRI